MAFLSRSFNGEDRNSGRYRSSSSPERYSGASVRCFGGRLSVAACNVSKCSSSLRLIRDCIGREIAWERSRSPGTLPRQLRAHAHAQNKKPWCSCPSDKDRMQAFRSSAGGQVTHLESNQILYPPPAASSIAPVMKAASSDSSHKAASAISPALPTRAMGIDAWM